MKQLYPYRYQIGGFLFRVRKIRRDWLAQVQMRDDKKWRTVVYPQGPEVLCATKKQLVKYLYYAYEGKE